MFKLHISCPEEHDSRKKTAFGKGWFFIKFGTGANFFLMPQGKFSSAQWKVQSTCSQKHSEEKMFSFLTKTYFSGLGTLTEAFLELSDKNNFVSFVENCIQRIRGPHLVKILPFWNFFQNWAQFLKTASTCPYQRLYENRFLWKRVIFLYLLLFSRGNFSGFCQKSYGRDDKSASCLSKGTFHVKQTFWKTRTRLIFTVFERFPFEMWPEVPTELAKLHIVC